MTILFANNATSRLKIDIPAASGTISLPSGEGDRFPATTAPDYFMVTVEDRTTNQMEIMKCIGRVADVLTVTRAQEGTVAQDFLVGATVSNRMTAGTLALIQTVYTKPEADAKFIEAAGDAMTGPLLVQIPLLPSHAASKNYVDTGLGGKADTVHTHVIGDVTGLQTALNGKEAVAPTTGGFYGRMGAAWVIPGVAEISGLQAALNAKPGEAPTDGTTYGRKNAAWVAAATDWNSITGKPGTFPPTLPIQQLDVVNLVVDMNAKVGEAPTDGQQYARALASWVVVTGGGSGGGIPEAPTDGQLYGRQSLAWNVIPAQVTWSTLTGKPATFPPTLPIAQADVTGLVAGQAAQDTAISNKEGFVTAGLATQYYRGDKTWVVLDKTAVGLANVDNTSDVNKPVSTATTAAINAAVATKEPVINAGTVGQYWRGDKAWATLDKAAVGLANVDNTSDANKPVSTAQAASIATKEPSLPAGGTVSNFLRGDKTWQAVPAAGTKLTSGTVAPSSPADNDLWWNNDLAALFLRYNDGTSTQWVQIG